MFVREAIIFVLRNLVPSFTPTADFRLELFDTENGYAVDTNLDFTKLNEAYHQIVPPTHSSISAEYLLSHIIDAQLDSYFAAHYLAEIVATPVYSQLIRLKHFDFLKRRLANERELNIFQEELLQDVPTLREVINKSERSVADFLKLLDEAERFREWLQNTNADAGLIRSYYQDSIKETWADKLPTKSIRFVIATGWDWRLTW